MLAGIFMIGTIGCVLAPDWHVLAAFRFILGLAVGGASATVPVYLAEMAPVERRGSIVTRNEVMIVSGQFAAIVINAIIFSIWGEHAGVWRYMLLVAVLPAIGLFIGMLRMPESPRWLSSQNRDDEALEVLRQVRSPERADAELAEVHALALEEKESQTGGWSDLATPWIRRLIIVGIGNGVFSQFSGINVIMYYGTHLLENAGFSSNGAIVANTLNGFFSVLGVTVGILLMNKFNRRSMIITGYVLTTTFHALVGIFALALPDNTVKPYVIMILVIGFVFSMQALIGPLTWLLLSEIILVVRRCRFPSDEAVGANIVVSPVVSTRVGLATLAVAAQPALQGQGPASVMLDDDDRMIGATPHAREPSTNCATPSPKDQSSRVFSDTEITRSAGRKPVSDSRRSASARNAARL